jgi:hypothetical protein
MDLHDLSDSDLVDAFIFHFRQWCKNKFGDNLNKPFSYLFSYHGVKYLKEIGALEDISDFINKDGANITMWQMASLGKHLIKNGHVKIERPVAAKEFLKNNEKKLEIIFKKLPLPKFFKFTFSEPNPNNLYINIDFDFDDYLKHDGRINLSPHSYEIIIKDALDKYLGVQFGKASHGKIYMVVSLPYLQERFEDWKKNVFNKKIKPQITKLPNTKNISSYRFKLDNSLKLHLGEKGSSTWNGYRMGKQEVRTLLDSLGYKQNLYIE